MRKDDDEQNKDKQEKNGKWEVFWLTSHVLASLRTGELVMAAMIAVKALKLFRLMHFWNEEQKIEKKKKRRK